MVKLIRLSRIVAHLQQYFLFRCELWGYLLWPLERMLSPRKAVSLRGFFCFLYRARKRVVGGQLNQIIVIICSNLGHKDIIFDLPSARTVIMMLPIHGSLWTKVPKFYYETKGCLFRDSTMSVLTSVKFRIIMFKQAHFSVTLSDVRLLVYWVELS